VTNKKCSKCKNDVFMIEEKESCDECVYNGAYDDNEGDYIHDKDIINRLNLERTQAFDNGECEIGSAHDKGCCMFHCTMCREQYNIPMVEP